MRHAFLFTILLLLPLSAFAQSAPPFTITALWRSDSGLEEATSLIKEKKYPEALLMLDAVIKRNVRNADAHVYSAIALVNLGNLVRAKTAINHAMISDRQ